MSANQSVADDDEPVITSGRNDVFQILKCVMCGHSSKLSLYISFLLGAESPYGICRLRGLPVMMSHTARHPTQISHRLAKGSSTGI